MRVFIAKSHWSGSRPLVSATLSMLGLYWDSSWLSCCCPVLWKFYSFGSAGPVPSRTPADAPWGWMLAWANFESVCALAAKLRSAAQIRFRALFPECCSWERGNLPHQLEAIGRRGHILSSSRLPQTREVRFHRRGRRYQLYPLKPLGLTHAVYRVNSAVLPRRGEGLILPSPGAPEELPIFFCVEFIVMMRLWGPRCLVHSAGWMAD